MRRPRNRRGIPALALLAALALVAGCGSTKERASAPSTTAPPPVVVTTSFANGATDVAADATIALSVRNGTLQTVIVTSAKGAGPAGVVARDHTSWQAVGGFVPSTAYTVAATVLDALERPSTRTFTFTTAAPAGELHTTLNVGNGGVYGVGMPIIVQLNHPVTADKHALLTQRLTVTADRPVNGAWRWFSDSEVHWRPDVFWATGTRVTLTIDFAGFNAGSGIWGVDGRTVSFGIGDAHVSTVDVNTHTMTVTSNGQVVRTIPVSTGRDAYPTKSGTHVVNEKAQKVIMDSATVGIPRDSPDGYYETVYWNVRISNSGEFVHAAPWSVASQGNTNVSHGCVNASDADAEWFYNFSQTGDVVQVNGSPEQLQPWNGYGDWQIPFAQWAN